MESKKSIVIIAIMGGFILVLVGGLIYTNSSTYVKAKSVNSSFENVKATQIALETSLSNLAGVNKEQSGSF